MRLSAKGRHESVAALRLPFEPVHGLPRSRATGPRGEAAGRGQRRSMTGFRGCRRSGVGMRMTQISLKVT